jgi:gamma-tubulin complex component 3
VATEGDKQQEEEADSADGLSVGAKEMEASLRALRYGGEMRLWETVRQIASKSDKRLLVVMRQDFHLTAHLQALKKFMLLGQGDFVTALMDLVGPELRKRASQLFRHNLSGMVEAALRSCTFSNLPKASVVLDRVGVRLLEASPGDVGWDVFSLDYSVDSPLTSVVHGQAMAKYRVAFHMLWRLQRVQWSLSAGWKLLMCFNHTRGSALLPRLKPVLHRCTLHRARMTHVVNNLCAYLMFEVIETAWAALQANCDKATCLDDIIHAHDKYLDEIHERALLSPHHEALNLQMQQMLQSVLRFCALEEALVTDALSSLARKRAAGNDAVSRSKAGGWGVEETVDDSALDSTSATRDSKDGKSLASVDGVPGYVIQRLDEAAKDYGRNFEQLMLMLRAKGEHNTHAHEEILRFLTFRLDFNGFYSRTIV